MAQHMLSSKGAILGLTLCDKPVARDAEER